MGKRIEHEIIDGIEYKWCSKCLNYKRIIDFYANNNSWDKLQGSCKSCSDVIHKRWRKENPKRTNGHAMKHYFKKRNEINELFETIDENFKEQDTSTNPFINKKRCSKCHRLLSTLKFYADERHNDGLMSACKSCVNKVNRERAQYKSNLLSPLIHVTEKVCINCGLMKKANEFVAHRSHSDGLASICKVCHAEKQYKRNLINKYGIDIVDWNRMLESQQHKCYICGIKFNNLREIHVDHSHRTNRVRSLLCRKCNALIGFANDNTDILESAIAYLQRFELEMIS